MREAVRYFGGGALVAAAGAWKLRGSHWGVIAELGWFPDLTVEDLLGVPVAAVGLLSMATAAPASAARRLLGVGSIVGAVLWVTSEWPWDDPVIPGLKWHRHGIHVLDSLAVVPFAVGLVALWPWRAAGRPALPVHRA